NYASNESAARQTATDCMATTAQSIRAEVCRADVSSAPARKSLVEFVRAKFNRLDLLVNNAGVAPTVREDLLAVTEESFDRLMNINVKGAFFLTQLVARWMVEQIATNPKSPAHCLKIVTITSVSAYAASVNRGEYCISK